MAVNINADTTTGLQLESDTSGNINIQNDGTTVVAVTSSGAAVTGTLSANGANISTQPTFRNRIINGNMRIDQRNAGASVTQGTGTLFTLDRFACIGSAASKFSVQQNAGSVTPPNGFTNYLGVTSLSAYTVGASERFGVWQIIEGYNIADLGWGTANAKTVTLSFVVRSSLTGQFGGVIYSSDRFYPFSYTISSANTWETKTITITGSTDGTWATDNSGGMVVYFNMGAGASQSATAGSWGTSSVRGATGDTSVVGTNGATWYVTGVQLEAGSSATDFETRPYDVELARCYRYYWQQIANESGTRALGVGAYLTTSYIEWFAQFPVQMRASPSIVSPTVVGGYEIYRNSGADAFDVVLLGSSNKTTAFLYNNTQVSGTAGQAGSIYCKDTYASSLAFSAEL